MFSASRVVARLAGYFSPHYSAPTRKEIALADAFRSVLQDASYADVDLEEEEDLQVGLDEIEDVEWTPEDDVDEFDFDDPLQKTLTCDGHPVTASMLTEAFTHYRSTSKKNRPLQSMSNQFRWIRTKNHLKLLRAFEKRNEFRENRVSSLKRLSADLQEKCMDAVKKGLPLSYSTLRHMALTINRECGFVDGFKASRGWISKFIRHCGLRSRKVTTFVTTRNLRERDQVEEAERTFVANVRAEMEKHPRSIFCNIDQSGINREVVSQRTLAPVGVRQVHRVVQSTSSLTHSYTVVPVLYADGRLGEELFVVLSQPGGRFPQSGHWSAPNLYVVPGPSHIMRKDQVPSPISECVMTGSTSPLTILLPDSWPGFNDHSNIFSGVPVGKQLKLMTIPAGATALCQPLDVYFFRLFKRFIRRIHEAAVHTRPNFNCFSRGNTLKVLSQAYRQFCAPIFRRCFEYAWFAAGYTDTHPETFSTPTDYAFNEVPLDEVCQGADDCSLNSFVRCCWCDKHLCFDCFIILPHTC